jgi:hypothetical protein
MSSLANLVNSKLTFTPSTANDNTGIDSTERLTVSSSEQLKISAQETLSLQTTDGNIGITANPTTTRTISMNANNVSITASQGTAQLRSQGGAADISCTPTGIDLNPGSNSLAYVDVDGSMSIWGRGTSGRREKLFVNSVDEGGTDEPIDILNPIDIPAQVNVVGQQDLGNTNPNSAMTLSVEAQSTRPEDADILNLNGPSGYENYYLRCYRDQQNAQGGIRANTFGSFTGLELTSEATALTSVRGITIRAGTVNATSHIQMRSGTNGDIVISSEDSGVQFKLLKSNLSVAQYRHEMLYQSTRAHYFTASGAVLTMPSAGGLNCRLTDLGGGQYGLNRDSSLSKFKLDQRPINDFGTDKIVNPETKMLDQQGGKPFSSELIYQLEPKSYTSNFHIGNPVRTYGFIAEEVEKVHPAFCIYTEVGPRKGVDFRKWDKMQANNPGDSSDSVPEVEIEYDDQYDQDENYDESATAPIAMENKFVLGSVDYEKLVCPMIEEMKKLKNRLDRLEQGISDSANYKTFRKLYKVD